MMMLVKIPKAFGRSAAHSWKAGFVMVGKTPASAKIAYSPHVGCACFTVINQPISIL
jgi:hypothetical protein